MKHMPHGSSSKNFWKFYMLFYKSNHKFWREDYAGGERKGLENSIRWEDSISFQHMLQ